MPKGIFKSIEANENRKIRATEMGKGARNRVYHPRITSARKIFLNTYNDGNLTFDDFYKLSQEPCHYCKRSLVSNRNIFKTANKGASEFAVMNGNFEYNGLDRIDNNLSHTLENVVTCCATCNYMKGELAYNEFVQHIKLIYNNLNV